MEEMQPAGGSDSMMDAAQGAQEERAVPEATAALVKKWVKLVEESKKHWSDQLDQMRRDMKFARGVQWEAQPDKGEEDRYIANITQRHIRQRVASLYAKDPTFVARARPHMDFTLWDENPATAMQAMQQLQAAGGDINALAVMSPAAAELLADIAAGMQARQLRQRTGKTLEVLFAQQIAEQVPPFKRQMKQHVRRAATCGVSYVQIGFQRVMEPRPEDAEKIRGVTEQLAEMRRLSAEMAEGEIRPNEAEVAQLEAQLAALQAEPKLVVKEGLVFDYPPSTSIIVDKRCRQLDGFIGAGWIAREYMLTPEAVKRTYGIDLKKFTRYTDNGSREDFSGLSNPKHEAGNLCCIWVIQSKVDGLVYVVADGYDDFLKEPAPPEVRLERFWTIFPLTFNGIEDESNPFPKSDVELIRPMQLDMNRARQGLREHRQAARPGWVAAKGILSDEDKNALKTAPAHSLTELDGILEAGGDVQKLLQAKPYPGIDPNLYQTQHLTDDVMHVLGMQEANVGTATGSATATEVAVAEGSRSSGIACEVDDLDDHLTELARAAGEILLREMPADAVRKLVGPGAVWPEQMVDEYIDTIALEIQAGSSGRPNKAAEVANFERMAPILLQIPGITPDWLARQAVKRLDDSADLTEAYMDGLPAITMMNSGKLPGNGATGAEGAGQGTQGGDNAPRPDGAQGPAPNHDAMPAA